MKLFFIFILLAISFSSIASERHHSNSNNGANATATSIDNNIYNTIPSGVALSLGAAAIDCNYSTERYQIGVGAGFYNDNIAPVVGGCKRFNDTLIKGSIGVENDEIGGNIGIMFPLN